MKQKMSDPGVALSKNPIKLKLVPNKRDQDPL